MIIKLKVSNILIIDYDIFNKLLKATESKNTTKYEVRQTNIQPFNVYNSYCLIVKSGKLKGYTLVPQTTSLTWYNNINKLTRIFNLSKPVINIGAR